MNGVLCCFGVQNAKSATAQMVRTFWTEISAEVDESIADIKLYEQIIGFLLYLALRSRLGVIAPVLVVAQYQKLPTSFCYQPAKRVLRCLKGSVRLSMVFEAIHMKLGDFMDSDNVSDAENQKSLSDTMIKLGSATCLLPSMKQPTVLLSTCEAEYHARTRAAKQTMWLRKVLYEAGFDIDKMTSLRSKNHSALNWVKAEQCPPARANHVDVQLHFILDLHRESTFGFPYVPSEENNAVTFTKLLKIVLHNAN